MCLLKLIILFKITSGKWGSNPRRPTSLEILILTFKK
nr:MAG TPA: hypothetical protein [Caudoviricetes sp.]